MLIRLGCYESRRELFKTPFYKLTLDQKLEVERLGPYQPKPYPLVQDCGGVCRTFRTSWYEKAEWLCYGEEKDALFCFYCLLFCTTSRSSWAKNRIRDLKHLDANFNELVIERFSLKKTRRAEYVYENDFLDLLHGYCYVPRYCFNTKPKLPLFPGFVLCYVQISL